MKKVNSSRAGWETGPADNRWTNAEPLQTPGNQKTPISRRLVGMIVYI